MAPHPEEHWGADHAQDFTELKNENDLWISEDEDDRLSSVFIPSEDD
jgi:hypothetical protein